MSGIGSFDQTGRIGSSLKSGLMNYGLGQGARYLGGADLQKGLSLKMPGGASSGIGQYFSKPYQPGQDIFSKTKERFFPGKEEITKNVFKEQMSPGGPAKYIEDLNPAKIIEKTDTGKLGKFIESLTDTTAKKIILGSMVGTGIYTAYTQGKAEIADLAQVARGEGLDIDGIRKEVQEALAGGEEAWAILQQKYPYVGEFPTKKAEGGRIGLYAGGVPSPYSMEDARKTSMQDKMGGITDVMKRADLFRSGDVGQMYMAEGGLMDMGGMEKDYRNDGGFVPIGEYEKKDDVPARLSKNEFVFTADAVRGAGEGDIDKGAEIMENMMKHLEQGGQISEDSQGLAGAQEMFDVSERIGEVI